MLFHLHFFPLEAATGLGVVTFGMFIWAYFAFVNHKIIPQTFHQLHHSLNKFQAHCPFGKLNC
jgi:hypothetical protein